MPLYRLPPWSQSATFSTLEQVLDWSMENVGAPAAWKKTRGKGVKVLIIDTGVQVGNDGKINHPDLIGAAKAGRDFTGSPFKVGDRQGHGTATFSLMGAQNNETGIVGICCEADFWIAKGLGDDGSGLNQWIAQAVLWGDELDVDVISFSGGAPQWDADLAAAIDTFVGRRKQRFMVAAAGNDGTTNSVNFPASHPKVLAVGAVDKNNNTAQFSSRGDEVDCAGPGVNVRCCNNQGSYGVFNGTSFACPLVAGIVVLMLARHRQMGGGASPLDTFEDLLSHIQKACIPSADADGQGWGLLRADKMEETVGEQPTTPTVNAPIGSWFEFNMPAKAGDIFSVGLKTSAPAGKDQELRAMLMSVVSSNIAAAVIANPEVMEQVAEQLTGEPTPPKPEQ